MREIGTITKWNDDRGFGFITSNDNSKAYFVHISSFPNDGIRPKLNECFTYETELESNGKLRAVKVQRPMRRTFKKSHENKSHNKDNNVFGIIILVVTIVIIANIGYGFYKSYIHRFDLERNMVDPAEIPAGCDGRTMCSQMTSCSEAKWFINNCPSTRMDGNHDGVPCVQQWCSN